MIARIAQHTQSTLSTTLYVGGVATDATGIVTVKITREDGTVLVAAGTPATDLTGTGVYGYTLSPAQTADLDLLTVEWTATLQGAVQKFTEQVEIVGDFLFTIAEARQMSPLGDAAKYPPDRIATERTRAEQALEDECGIAFVPRYAREPFNGNDTDYLRLRARPRSVLAVTVDDVVLAAAELATLRLHPTNAKLYRPAGWPLGERNVIVKYLHGYDRPPPRVGRACALLAKSYLVESPYSDRTKSVRVEGASASLAVAGVDGPFDIPEANVVVQRYARRLSLS